jgi:OOP family OmpA-OmpF porin
MAEAPAPVHVAPAPAPAPAPQPAPIAVVALAPVSEKVTFASDALFDFDQALLKPEGKTRLDELAARQQGVTLEAVVATGHTDSVGSDGYNDRLSMRRAEAVKSYLVSRGTDASRVFAEGKGEKQPVADNATVDGRAQNRRVQIEVVGTRMR